MCPQGASCNQIAVEHTAVTEERDKGKKAPDAEGALVHDLVAVHLQDSGDSPHLLVTDVDGRWIVLTKG